MTDFLESKIKPLVEALDTWPEIEAFSSCEGHKSPDWRSIPHVTFTCDDGSTLRKICERLRGTQCLIALRRWQLDHDGTPPDLETIVKAAGMQGVPPDPYTGRPLQMTTVNGEPVIYSVGMDGKDDQGRVDIWKSAQPGKIGDLLFRLNTMR